MRRLIDALMNSARAFRHLARHEAAFREELIVLAIGIPCAWLLSASLGGFLLLLGALLLVLLVEALNTGLEAVCDALSRDFNEQIRLAKDCGSLGVLLSIIIAAGIWGHALWERIAGVPI